MKLDQAGTHAFAEFHDAHEQLNLALKTAEVSLLVLKDDLQNEARSIDDVKQLCYARRELWGGMPAWGNAASMAIRAIDASRHDLGSAGIIRAFSAFDVFMETLEGELNTWELKLLGKGKAVKDFKSGPQTCTGNQAGGGTGEQPEEDPATKVSNFYQRHDWPMADIAYLLPIYTYFQLLRNCVAHANAFVTPALKTASQPEMWQKSIDDWPLKTKDVTAPTPTTWKEDDAIKVSYRDAILASSLLRMVAWDMSQRAVGDMGASGCLYVIASRILKRKTPLVAGGKSYFSLFHEHLKLRYRFEDLTAAETRILLTETGLWKSWRDWHDGVAAEKKKTTSDAKRRNEFAPTKAAVRLKAVRHKKPAKPDQGPALD